MTTETTTCEVCDQTAPTRKHPCRFEKACRCWRGEPCELAERQITKEIAA